MNAASPPRRCRHCQTTADRCRARHGWTGEPCCDECLHDWTDHTPEEIV